MIGWSLVVIHDSNYSNTNKYKNKYKYKYKYKDILVPGEQVE